MASTAALQLIISMQDNASKGMDNIAKKGGFLKNALSFAAGGAILGGISAAGGAVGDFFGGALDEAKEAQLGMAQLNSVLTSTGGAAGLTADEVLALSSKLSSSNGLSMFSADATLAANNLLLTFTEIGEDVFPLASQAAVDMAQALGGDPVSQSKALGKALNDPVKGVSALSKVGVTFTDKQKDVIKALVETGDKAGAQKIILAELAKEFGGSASNAAKTFEGRMATLAEKFDDVKEGIGNALMPALEGIATFGTEVFDAFSTGDFSRVGTLIADTFNNVVSWVGSMIGPLMTAIGGWARAFVDWIVPLIPQMISALSGFIGEAVGWIASQVPVFMSAVLGWGRAFVEWVAVVIPEAIGALAGFIGQVIDWIVTQAPVLVNSIIAWANAFVDWIVPMIPIWAQKAADFIGGILSWLQEQIPAIVTMIAGWATAFVNWILDSIPLWLAAAGTFISGVLSWLGEQIGPIAAQLQAWGIAFVQWIGEAIPPLLGKLGDLAMDIIKWLGDELPGIIGQLAAWALAFVEWVLPVLVPLLIELGKMLIGIGAWIITEALPGIVNMLLEWIKAFVDWVGPALAQLLTKLKELAEKIWSWIATTATDAYNKAIEIGKGIIKGIWDGITNVLPAALDASKNAVNQLLDIMKEEAGVKSPSTVTLEVGKNIMQGLIGGIAAMVGLAIVASTAAAVAVLNAANTALGTTGGASPLFQSMGQLAMAGLQKGIDANGHLAVTAVDTQVSKLLPTAKANLGDWYSVGAAISAGVNAGINATWPGVVANIMGKARALAAQARAALDIRSPSGVFMRIGEQMMEGWAAGIERGGGLVRGAIGSILPTLIPAYSMGAGGGSPSSRIGFGDMGDGGGRRNIVLNVNHPASGADGFRIGREIVGVLEDLGLHDRLVHP